MADWSLPGLTDVYSNILTYLKNRLNDAVLWLDSSLASPTNLPTGAKRWNAGTYKFERWSGSAWADLAATYAISISGNAATATTATKLNGQLASYYQPAATALTTSSIGSTVQGYDALLAAIAALVTSADKMPYFTGVDAPALTALTAFARTLLDDASATAARTTLGCGDVAPLNIATAFASSLSASGYQKLPSGFVFQWLNAGALGQDSQVTVTFPIAFPNVVCGVFWGAGATVFSNSSTGENGVKNVSLTGCTLVHGHNSALTDTYVFAFGF